MLEFRQKNRIKKFLYSPLTLIFLFVVLLLLVKAVWGVYIKEHTSALNLAREKADLEKLTVREESLTQSVNYLKTDEGVEAEIRNKFRVAKEGESVAVILDDSTSSKPVAAAASSAPRSFWQKVLHFFGF